MLELAQGSHAGAVRRRGRLEVLTRCCVNSPEQGSWASARRSGCHTCARRFSIPTGQRPSSLKPEIVSGLDILIIRELTGDIYFRYAALACA